MAVKAGGVDLRGGHWEAFGLPVRVLVGRGGVLWAGAEECGRWNDGIIDTLVTCLVAV